MLFRTRRIMRRRGVAAKRADPARHEQAPDAGVAAPPESVAQMRELDELREQGILTREEFAAEKRKLLGI